jgi:hypothetical protein
MFVGFFTAQAYGLTTARDFPRPWIVVIDIVLAAVSIAYYTEFDAQVGVSRPCCCNCFLEQMPIHTILHLKNDAHSHRVLVIGPIQVKTLNI